MIDPLDATISTKMTHFFLYIYGIRHVRVVKLIRTFLFICSLFIWFSVVAMCLELSQPPQKQPKKVI